MDVGEGSTGHFGWLSVDSKGGAFRDLPRLNCSTQAQRERWGQALPLPLTDNKLSLPGEGSLVPASFTPSLGSGVNTSLYLFILPLFLIP